MTRFVPNYGHKNQKKLNVNYQLIIQQLLKNWWLILTATAIASMLIYVFVTETYKETYSTEATFIVYPSGSQSAASVANIDSARTLAGVVSNVLNSQVVLNKALEAAEIKNFKGKMVSSQLGTTNILSLKVTSESPSQAFSVLNSVIEHNADVLERVVSNASLSVFKRPTVPSKPDIPINRRNKVIQYSLAAFVLFVGISAVNTMLSTKIYNETDFIEKVGEFEKFATLEHVGNRKSRRLKKVKGEKTSSRSSTAGNLLVNNPTTSFGYSETIRLVQTRLQYLMKMNGARTLMVASVYADEGRSTIAANLALTFARENSNVLLIEADMAKPSIAKLLGVNVDFGMAIDEYLSSDEQKEPPRLDGVHSLSLLVCRRSVSDGLKLLSSKRMQDFMEEARRKYDFIIIDTPPVAVSNVADYCAELSDAGIMVVRQGFAPAKRIQTALETLSANTDMLGYMLNDAKSMSMLGGITAAGVGGVGSYGSYAKHASSYGNYSGSYGNYGNYGRYGNYGNYGNAGSNGFEEPADLLKAGALNSDVKGRGDAFERRMMTEPMNPIFADERGGSQPEKASDEIEIDLLPFITDTAKTFFRILWLPIITAVAIGAFLIINQKRSYAPKYTSSAVFNISPVGAYNSATPAYSRTLANRLESAFPYILESGILDFLICEDLGVKSVPAKLSAKAADNTAMFTINSTAQNPQQAYDVLVSTIKNYPRVFNLVTGNTNMQMIANPELPAKPINPINYKPLIAIAAAIGVVTGLIAAIITNMMKRTVGGIEEIRKLLNLRCIGTLPFERRLNAGSTLVTIDSEKVSKSFEDAVTLIRKRIEKSASENGEKVIVFAGSIPGEGKSTVALNTALALAESGKKIVFLDGDIRKPSSIMELNGTTEKTLVNYLKGEAEAEDIIGCVADNFFAICGSKRIYNAPEILRTDRFEELIQKLRGMADYVIIDSPPSSILVDVQIIAGYCDAIVYIVCQDYTTKNALNAGINNLASVGKRFIGYVLNNAGSSETGQSYSKQSNHSAYGNYGKYGSYGGHGKYGKYGKYGGYGKYGKYGKYGGYGKYGKYVSSGKYGKYGGYGKYGKYGAYGDYGAYGNAAETQSAKQQAADNEK